MYGIGCHLHSIRRGGSRPDCLRGIGKGRLALPCRISIYEEDGKTIPPTLKATTLLAMLNGPQLEGMAQEVENTMVK